ncbi:mannitol dehydrogenase family protein [Ancylobacter defluvii]|uniref:Mannitol dehydrogenase n=1 Tax=Ancylobacter defluvii TaxID=1282440 RepID=A0A9W6JWW1_9HYPH|nr:mannitol dehydrogenase family protein [Ancylobacter defluvii]MBS7590238.1 mannitol dehydrogenase family protein [Ancylobacter defluvii]GLK82883.1 mannitol dehydrogenase [Ancylobacter defluvii]
MNRLSATAFSAGAAVWPRYRPEEYRAGIVHLGLGNFARAHLLDYTDKVLARRGGDWRVIGVSLRGTAVAEALNPQDGRYVLIERGLETHARVIGALKHVIAGPRMASCALAAMSRPGCRIVSITVTEKGYGIASDGALDRTHPAVAADLAHPEAPAGVIGLIVAALAARRAARLPAFTVLSCDNLSHNGQKLRRAVLEFADATYPHDLAGWIAAHATFPSTMVDRITPAATRDTLAAAQQLTGHEDIAAVETEPFRQWVIEDDFSAGRPEWELEGALFVRDVGPYEQMKLRMLNGAHSMLAYSGQLSGKAYVRDVMADPAHAVLVRRHLKAAAATVRGLAIDLDAYATALAERFTNPSIAHATAQIAMDGTQKLPQRITAPAMEAMEAGSPVRPFAFALSSWVAYLARRDACGAPIRVDDPRADALIAAVSGRRDAATLLATIAAACPDVLPEAMSTGAFGARLEESLDAILREGMTAVITQEAMLDAE